ncbi:MAG: DUF4867 family protein [Oscillospiraceae bacterium]|nr:DUF4867 family protein [Oscillospiraceae bacterium]
MTEMLNMLREKNPGLPLFSVLDPEFRRYGRVLSADTRELAAALAATPIPETGNRYVASLPELEAVDLMPALQRVAFGEMPIQAGCCNGNGYKLNAMEYHKCSELNFTTTGLVLLLALPEQLDDGKLRSADVVGFYLPEDVLVEIYPMVLHFAPCRVKDTGFRCLVVLEQGTNAALPSVDTTAPGEEKLLWMRNKWMTCHPDSPQKEKGAFVGIRGENLALKI